MDAALASIFEALQARGTAPLLCTDDGTSSAVDFLATVEELSTVPPPLREALVPGAVVALDVRDATLACAGLLAAWSLGCSTFHLSAREPAANRPALLEEAGCSLLLAEDEAGRARWSSVPNGRALPGPVSTLLRTSGSAGRPKLAVHALTQHVASARAAIKVFNLGPQDRWLLSLPAHHVAGLGILLRCLLSGATLCLPKAGADLATALARHRPTHVSLVATQLGRLLDRPQSAQGLSATKAVLVGGSPIAAGLRARALDAGVPLVMSYGSTETSALITATKEASVIRRPRSAGRPLPGRIVELDADDEIRVGGPTLFRGYLEGESIEDKRGPDGLFATGDLGRFDEDGVLYVTGRKDRLFISGGENVQPEEVEAALLTLDGVKEAVVVAVDDEEFGRRPIAFLHASGPVDAKALQSALRARLAAFKVPTAFYPLPDAEPGALKPSLARLEGLAADPAELRAL